MLKMLERRIKPNVKSHRAFRMGRRWCIRYVVQSIMEPLGHHTNVAEKQSDGTGRMGAKPEKQGKQGR